MTTKNGIVSILSICILGIGLLACGTTRNFSDKKPGNINEAFDQVVQVLHAPYDNGDVFFRIFTGDKAINEHKNGVDSQIGKGSGDATNTGSGTWTVTAGKDKKVADGDSAAAAPPADNSIIYSYTKYQPNGSNIYVNGKMLAMYRSTGQVMVLRAAGPTPVVDAMGFNKIGSAVADKIYRAVVAAHQPVAVGPVGGGIPGALLPPPVILDDKEDKILYEYKAYQPKGSPINVTGKMAAMYRSTGQVMVLRAAATPVVDAIGFNKIGLAVTDKIYRAVAAANQPAVVGVVGVVGNAIRDARACSR